MKRAFDENVSKSKPKLRLGKALAGVVEAEPGEPVALTPPPPRALDGLHAIAERVASETVHANELHFEPAPVPSMTPGAPVAAVETVVEAKLAPPPAPVVEARVEPVAPPVIEKPAPMPAPGAVHIEAPKAVHVDPPKALHVEPPKAKRAPIQQAIPIAPPKMESAAERREKLKERLKRATAPVSVRDPAPASAAEAEAAALSMIGQLQHALERAEAENDALKKDLETSRAQLSRAAAEARERTDEAQSLATEVGNRSKLLEDLTGELAALEAERDDALSQLSGARAEAESQQKHGFELEAQLRAKENELLEAIAE